MFERKFLMAVAALVLGVTLAGQAEAYPTTARRGTTTVTGVYNPLALNLTLEDGTDALSYNSGTGLFSFSATFSGTYLGTGPGYSGGGVTGQAGNWQLLFEAGGISTASASVAGNVITLNQSAASGVVGRLTFLGTGIFDFTDVPPEDKPATNDYFEIYAVAGDFLQVSCLDGTGSCDYFDMVELQNLMQLGPFVVGAAGVDGTRLNTACGTAANSYPCGGIQVRATSIPEPASLALVGLGLVGIALARRRRHPA